jgi:hypothetical protein
LLADDAARGEIERAARVRMERDYSWDAIGDAQARLYETIVS